MFNGIDRSPLLGMGWISESFQDEGKIFVLKMRLKFASMGGLGVEEALELSKV